MLNSFLVVGTQVLILFVLIALGFLGGKIKIMNKDGVKCINDIMLYFVTPCVIIHAFQREYEAQLLHNLLLAVLGAFISHAIGALLGYIFIRKQHISKKKVLRFAIIFSNCGFMAFPLINALLGSEGLFYAAGYVAVFNLIVWSYGKFIMDGGEDGFDIKKAVLNPGVISVIVGFIMFVSRINLPEVLATPIGYMSDLNTPVAMLIIGYTISTMDLKELLNFREEALTIVLRLIVCPLLLLAVLYAVGFRGIVLVSCIVSGSAPIAATTNMFAIKYNGDEKLSSKLVAVSTVFSILTMTLIVGFTQFVAM